MLKKIFEKARTKRLALDLSKQTLSKKSGVSYGVLKKVE
jgi:predicted transcriptional regulator